MATREALGEMWHTSTGTPRGAGRACRVAERPVVLEKRGNARGGKGPQVRSGDRRGKGLGSGESLKPRQKGPETPEASHAKVKGPLEEDGVVRASTGLAATRERKWME